MLDAKMNRPMTIMDSKTRFSKIPDPRSETTNPATKKKTAGFTSSLGETEAFWDWAGGTKTKPRIPTP